jgi:hypothetical protein
MLKTGLQYRLRSWVTMQAVTVHDYLLVYMICGGPCVGVVGRYVGVTGTGWIFCSDLRPR